MTTWTLEHAKAIVAAWPNVEECDDGRWHKVGYGLDNPYICTKELGRPERFRLPPKKQLVEWTASDVKPGMVFRHRSWTDGTFRNFYEISVRGIYFSMTQTICPWKELAANWLWSLDASPGSWRPCVREVEG